MKDDYKIQGSTKKIEIELESEVVNKLLQMELHSKFTKSELVNTAFKRFITAHKDFLPANDQD